MADKGTRMADNRTLTESSVDMDAWKGSAIHARKESAAVDRLSMSIGMEEASPAGASGCGGSQRLSRRP